MSFSIGGVLTTVSVVAPANAVVKGSAPRGTEIGKIDKNSVVGKEIQIVELSHLQLLEQSP